MSEGMEIASGASPADAARGPILAQRWPALAAALRQHQENVAEAFTQRAYDAVEHGLIRLDERRRLAAEAEGLGIKAFDAQLLIACAVRQWALDHRFDDDPSPEAPRLSREYRAWKRGWLRFAIVASTAVGLDLVILWNWLR